MGFVKAVFGATNATEWSSYSGLPPATVIYVSTSGSDSNNGTSVATPVQHLATALTKAGLDTPGADKEAWILHRQGDVWTDETYSAALYRSGISSTQPIIFSSYDPALPGVFHPGTGPRPVIQVLPTQSGLVFPGSTGATWGDKVCVIGLEQYNYKRDPLNASYVPGSSGSTAGGGSGNPATFLWYEDCKTHFFGGNNYNFQGSPSANLISGVTLYRCIISDAYRLGAYATGVYSQWINSQIVECFFDSNGWNATIGEGTGGFDLGHSHNFYLQHGEAPTVGPTVITGSFFSNDASGSMSRAGGTLDNNFWVQNPFPHNITAQSGVTSSITNSVYLQSCNDASGTSYGWGPQAFGLYQGFDLRGGTLSATNNIVANTAGSNGFGFFLDDGYNGCTISNNIFYNWHDQPNNATFTGSSSGNTNLTATGTFGCIAPGNRITGTGVPANTYIVSGPATGSNGTYVTSQATTASGTITCEQMIIYALGSINSLDLAGGSPGTGYTAGAKFIGFIDDGSTSPIPSGVPGQLLTVTSVASGALFVGQVVDGDADHAIAANVAGQPVITSFGTGTGGTGTYHTDMQGLSTIGAVPNTFLSTTKWYGVPLVYAAGHSGAGTYAKANVTVDTSGHVSDIEFYVGTDFESTNSGALPAHISWGIGYVAGDILTATPAPPSYTAPYQWSGFSNNTGSGFTVRVASIASNTISANTTAGGTNVVDPTGLNNQGAPEPFPHPDRSIGSYAGTLGLTPSLAGFLNAVKGTPGLPGVGMSRHNWNPNYTASAINTYIRAGFGIVIGLILSPSTLADGSVGISYNQTITASGGTGSYTFSVLSGTLPTGLSLSSLGVLSGTPNFANTFIFTIQAIDTLGITGNLSYMVTIGSNTIKFLSLRLLLHS